MPDSVFENLDVVQLSRLTRKKKRYPCYGLQWGTSIYLYPVGVDLVEVYSCPPRPQLKRETEMYGGRWSVDQGHKLWVLEWNETTILDFYLNNVLIHEIGHLVDHRNKNYLDRERFADWYAIEFGYRKTQAERKKRLGRNRSPIKRHDKS